MKKFSLGKKEKLKSQKEISRLFQNGKFLFSGDLRLVFETLEQFEQPKVKIAVSVPKKLFKLAVDRNLIKRRIREAYRLSKNILIENTNSKNISLNIMFIYSKKSIAEFSDIKFLVENLLKKISKKFD